MIWMAFGLAVGAALAVVAWVARRRRYYRRIFSEAHFREVHERFARAVETVEAVPRASAAEPVATNAFVTSAQLAIVVTESLANEGRKLHVSLSQPSGFMTSAVASRFGFLLVTTLNRNKMQLNPFATPSGVHHLVFTWDGAPLALNDFGSVMDQYRTGYQPLPFAFQSLAGSMA